MIKPRLVFFEAIWAEPDRERRLLPDILRGWNVLLRTGLKVCAPALSYKCHTQWPFFQYFTISLLVDPMYHTTFDKDDYLLCAVDHTTSQEQKVYLKACDLETMFLNPVYGEMPRTYVYEPLDLKTKKRDGRSMMLYDQHQVGVFASFAKMHDNVCVCLQHLKS